jgi:hypothetical protein
MMGLDFPPEAQVSKFQSFKISKVHNHYRVRKKSRFFVVLAPPAKRDRLPLPQNDNFKGVVVARNVETLKP